MRRSFVALPLALAVTVLLAACGGGSDQPEDDAVATVPTRSGTVSEHIRAQSFELVDADGKVRGVFESVGGDVGLRLMDSLGRERIKITVDDADLPSVTLFDEGGSRRIGMEFALGLNPALFLRDSDGVLKAGMQVQRDGGPVLFFRSVAAENSFAVALVGDDLPVISLADPGGNSRVFLGLGEGSYDASLVFVSETGEPISSIP